jgi:hypothetical protein
VLLTKRSNGVIDVTIIRRFSEKYQVIGGGDSVRSHLPLDPESTPRGGLNPGGVSIFVLKVISHLAKWCQLLPTSDEGTGSTDSVALAGHLHVLDDGLD